MTVVKFIRHENRLAKLLKLPGGKRVQDALDDAAENLLAIAPACFEALDSHIAAIGGLTLPGAATDWDQVYAASNHIVGLGAMVGLAELGVAAHSLCELIDRTRAGTGPDMQTVKVHVNSLRLLRLGNAVPAVERAKVLDGLAAVVDRIAPAAA